MAHALAYHWSNIGALNFAARLALQTRVLPPEVLHVVQLNGETSATPFASRSGAVFSMAAVSRQTDRLMAGPVIVSVQDKATTTEAGRLRQSNHSHRHGFFVIVVSRVLQARRRIGFMNLKINYLYCMLTCLLGASERECPSPI